MNNLKRFLALVLAMSMMLTAVPFGAFAAGSDITHMASQPADGETTDGDPFNDDASYTGSTTGYTNYRIPGIVMLEDGTLVASADIRYDYEYDGGGSDIMISRSADNGATWNYSVAAYMGDNGNVHNTTSSTMMDPVIITDGTNLYLLYDLFPAGYSLAGGTNTTHAFSATGTGFDGSGRLLLGTTYNSTDCNYYLENGKIYATGGTEQSSYTVDEWFNVFENGTYVSNLFFADSPFYAYPTSYVCMQTSTDGGENWSDPELLNIKHDGTAWQVLGPGSGIVTSSGELAFTVYNSDSSISLVHGKSGAWKTVKTSAATNESSIVELSDGTIRAFVKNNNNVITYVDFTKSGDSYTAAASAKSTGIANTGWCMVSSMMYSKQIDGKDVILVCCPSTGSSVRANGKIHVFTLDESNNMTHLKSYEINSSNEFFAYSDMVEMEDGTIALLYEDGCMYYSSGSNGVGYSHIEYITVDPVENLGLTFNADLEQDGVKVQLSTSAGVNHMHVESATVDSITTAYSAYNVVLCTDTEAACTAGSSCTSTYTGSATVTIPLTDALKSADNVKGFVVDSDGSINSVYNVEKTDDSVTFVAPHFSVVGIAEVTADEIPYTNEEDITVYVGETKEIPLTEDLGDGSQNGTIADVAWAGSTITVTVDKATAGLADDASYSDDTTLLDSCLYTFNKNEDGTYTISGQTSDGTPVYLYHLTNKAGFPNSTTENSVSVTTETDGFRFYITDNKSKDSYLYFHDDGNNRFNRTYDGDSMSQCLFQLYRPVKDGEVSSDAVPGYIQVSSTEELDGGQFLIVASYNTPTYVLHPSTVTSTNYWDHVAMITGDTQETSTPPTTTTITITGKTAGTTSVVIGDTKYNITVKQDVRNVTLKVGGSYTDTIEDFAFTAEDAKVENSSIATLDKVEGTTVAGSKELVEITNPDDLVEGKQYLIYNIREAGLLTDDPITDNYWDGNNYTGLKIEGAVSVDSTELWTYTADSGLMQNGKYLTFGDKSAGTTDTATSLTLDYTTGSGWRIIYDGRYLTDMWGNSMNGVYGYTDASSGTPTDGGNYFRFYEIVETPAESSTKVTITGLKVGTTTATIGHVKYNITVEAETRTLALKIGETKTDTINGVGYSMNDVTKQPDSAIATLNSVTSTGAQLIPVTEIESGKYYLIVNSNTGDVLTNTAVTATSTDVNWGAKYGLDTTGKAAIDSTELWQITASGNGFTIVQDNKYLTISGFYAVMSDTATALTLNYSDSGWTIMDNTTCASLDGHDQADFYLSDNAGSGYDEAALGTSDTSNAYRYWTIYEINAAGSTNVTFTGVAQGETTAVIGGVTYNITVAEDIREIKLHTGQTKTFYIDNSNYTTGTINDSTIATLDSVVPAGAKLVSVSEIVSGEKYLIVNSQTGEVLTDTAITLTGDSGEKSALVTDGAASVNSTELWTITGDATNGYTVVQNGKYLTIAGYYAAMSGTETALKLTRSNSGWLIYDDTTWEALGHKEEDYYLRNGIADANYAADAMGSSIIGNVSYWNIYKIDSTPVTEVTFTGVKADETTATVGHVTFKITVDDVSAGDISDFTNIVGKGTYSDDNSSEYYRSVLDMTGKKVTSLRISEGAQFQLDVDVTGYDSVTWTAADPATATVDANGMVTAVTAGETVITATVVKNGIEESISIPVTVVPSLVEGYADSAITSVFYYIEEVEETDPYYTMFLSTESTTEPVDGHRLVMVSEGEVIWLERPIESAFAWVWTADPWEEHALTLMTSTGSRGDYYPLKNADGGLGSCERNTTNSDNPGAYYKYSYSYENIVRVGNDVGASWETALDALLAESILIGKGIWDSYGCDGAMSNTRYGAGTARPGGDPTHKLVTSMTFISDPMPHIEKSVNGVLPITCLRKDFRPYTEGMVATVGEYVYFQIDITVDRPTVWVKDDNGNDTTTGAIDYSNAIVLDDDLEGAYFYVQADDTNMNGVIDSNEGERLQTEDITERLNAGWGANEETRTISLYLIYIIQTEDIPKFVITNTADLTWNYQSHYSTGALAGKADAKASITVVGSDMEDVVIDFGQSIAYTGLTADQLKYVSVGASADWTANYGTVTVEGVGNPIEAKESDDKIVGYYYDEYEVTYTPTSILQEPDVVLLYGTYTDWDSTNDIEDGTPVRKVINGFIVYPATSVYYEEGFMFNDNSDGWTVSEVAKATVNQTLEKLGVYDSTDKTYHSVKQHPYGFDPIYDGVGDDDVTATAASSSTVGDTTSFQFTGTGFELYAHSTTETGRVAVSVYDANNELVNMYVVNTVAANGSTDATTGQSTDLDSLPIVSVKDLTHGTYTVTLTKVVVDSGKGTENPISNPVYLDGVRIINTVNESEYVTDDGTSNSPFIVDLEDKPEFYQLRDYVLSAMNVTDLEDSMYAQLGEDPSISKIANQIYAGLSSDSEAPSAAILASGTYDSDVQDLLDNGPKNEIYLHEGETLVFKVSTNRMMQIGLKAPQGSATYSLQYTVNDATTKVADNVTLNTSVDMFYELNKDKLTNAAEYTITITNNGSNILSVTDLKICDDPNAVFVPLTAEDIKSTLVTMGYGVAENTTTGASYESVSEALSAAQSGETVQLLADCTETSLMVTKGISLDLNGFDLTASYVAAFDGDHIIDNAGGGSLIIAESSLVLAASNAMVPVYNGTAYVFTKSGFAIRQDTAYTGEGIRINAMAYPLDLNVVDLLKDGCDDNNMDIVIRLSWDTDQGTGSQDFTFNETVVSDVYNSNKGTWNSYGKMFTMTITGFESIENLKATILVVSGTGVEYVSPTSLSITE